jgi:hypothetical protein
MEKLTDIARIVIDVGKSCKAHGLVEEDLPDGVRDILKSLHRYVGHFLIQVSFSDAKQRFGWNRRRVETVCRDKVNQDGATACGHTAEGQEIRCQVIQRASIVPGRSLQCAFLIAVIELASRRPNCF